MLGTSTTTGDSVFPAQTVIYRQSLKEEKKDLNWNKTKKQRMTTETSEGSLKKHSGSIPY